MLNRLGVFKEVTVAVDVANSGHSKELQVNIDVEEKKLLSGGGIQMSAGQSEGRASFSVRFATVRPARIPSSFSLQTCTHVHTTRARAGTRTRTRTRTGTHDKLGCLLIFRTILRAAQHHCATACSHSLKLSRKQPRASQQFELGDTKRTFHAVCGAVWGALRLRFLSTYS
jgi:hypothetical protein